MAFEILATFPRSALRALRSGLASRRRRLTLAVALLLLGLLVACAPSISEREAVHVLTYDGTVDPVMVGYIDRGIDEAERSDARAVVLRLPATTAIRSVGSTCSAALPVRDTWPA